MKQYKIDLANEIIKAFDRHEVVDGPLGESDRYVKFETVAETLGYSRKTGGIKKSEIIEIVNLVHKLRPELYAYRYNGEKCAWNHFQCLWITDVEEEADHE